MYIKDSFPKNTPNGEIFNAFYLSIKKKGLPFSCYSSHVISFIKRKKKKQKKKNCQKYKNKQKIKNKTKAKKNAIFRTWNGKVNR